MFNNYYELFSDILLNHICFDKLTIERKIVVRVFPLGQSGYTEYVFTERKEFISAKYHRW